MPTVLCVLTSLCVGGGVYVSAHIRDMKMYSFLFIKGYAYSKSFWGKQFKTGHLSLGSWKKSLV